MKKILEEYLLFLKQKEYLLAHSKMEELWIALKGSEGEFRNLVKGFINGASTFVLHKRDPSKDTHLKTWVTYNKYTPLIESASDELLPLFLEAKEILENDFANLK